MQLVGCHAHPRKAEEAGGVSTAAATARMSSETGG